MATAPTNVVGRLGLELGFVIGAAQTAVSVYGTPSCVGRFVGGAAGSVYYPMLIAISLAGVTLGALAMRRGAAGTGLAAIITNLLVLVWPV